MAIDGYFISGYWWLLMAIILVAILLVDIGGYWWLLICRNPSLGFDQGKGVARLRAKRKPESQITYSRECKKVRGSEPSHSQGNFHFGRWSPDGLLKLQRAILGVKNQWLVAFFISLEISWNADV